jgi:hypothetical protein
MTNGFVLLRFQKRRPRVKDVRSRDVLAGSEPSSMVIDRLGEEIGQHLPDARHELRRALLSSATTSWSLKLETPLSHSR